MVNGGPPNKDRRILVVDDDSQLSALVNKALSMQEYQVMVASSGEEALSKMDKWFPHLVLLDINMTGIDGLETLKNLRRFPEYVSTIFVSGQSKPQDIIYGLDSGADDYVTKPLDIGELLARVRCQLRIKDLNDDLKRANKKLQNLVDIDDLTGLFNMRSLYNKLDNEMDRARRYKRSLCVLMMDMDHFKRVNDQNDHLFGSFVLSQVGQIIQENIRKIDFAARYGGDEFLIVLTEISIEGAVLFAERLRKKIADFLFKSENYSIHLTASIGLAVTDAENYKCDSRDLVRIADHALYKAKESGRNCYVKVDLAEYPSIDNIAL